MTKKINVYIPVEVGLREIYPKAFLAAYLTKKGYRVFILPDYMLPRLDLDDGIVLGKNQIHIEKWKRNRRINISFVLLEEEGAPPFGTTEHKISIVQNRLSHVISIANVISSWGRWQAEAIRQITSLPVVCTGSLYTEICKPLYQKAGSELDDQITKNMKGYILINTRFAFANGDGAPYTAFTGNPTFEYDRATPGYWRDHFSNDMSMIGAFIKLIEKIAKNFPETLIVLRPHPAENRLFYEGLFSDYKNIHVENTGFVLPWIRNALCILTNGCTTSLQAEISRTPVINYLPSFCHNQPTIFDGIGLTARSEDEVIDALKMVKKKEYEPFKIGEWADPSDSFSLKINFFDGIGYIVDQISKNHSEVEFKIWSKFAAVGKSKIIIYLKKVLKRTDHHNEFRNFPIYYNYACNHFVTTSNLNEIVENCYVLE